MANKKVLDDDIQALATEIREQAVDLRGELFLSFSYTADVFNRFLDIELARRGANRTRINILHNLVTHGGSMIPTEIARRVFRSKHAVSRAIDTLEKNGLVKRGLVSGDRRLRKVSITKKGLDLVKANMAGRQKVSHQGMSCLDQRQAEELRVVLKQLRKHLLSLISESGSER